MITSHWQPSSVFALSFNGLSCPRMASDGMSFATGSESLEDLCAAWLVDDNATARAQGAPPAIPPPLCPVAYCCGGKLPALAVSQLQSPVAAATSSLWAGGDGSQPQQPPAAFYKARDIVSLADGSLAEGWREDGWLQLVTPSNGSKARCCVPDPNFWRASEPGRTTKPPATCDL